MAQKSDRIRIDLTDAQKKQVKEQAGADVQALEFTAKELEERIAPRPTFGDITITLTP